METSAINFERNRFEVFGKLFGGSGGTVKEFQHAVDEQQQLEDEMSGEAGALHGEKKVTPLYESVWKITFSKDAAMVRYMLRIHYDDHHYKSIVVKADTPAKVVCAIGARKLGLPRFSFGLVGIFGKAKLKAFEDDCAVGQVIEQWVAEGVTSARFLFLSPLRNAQNMKMRDKVIKRWLNWMLKGKHGEVKDLKKDLADGIVLIKLAHALTGKKLPHNSSPSNKAERAHNLLAVFELYKSCGIVVPGDAVAVIEKGSAEGVIGVVWSLIFRDCTLRNSIGWGSDESTKMEPSEFVFIEGLRAWCQTMVETYPDVNVEDFCGSWADGRCFSALLEMTDNYVCSAHRMMEIEDGKLRLREALRIAEEKFGVPPLLDADDFANEAKMDEVAVIVYLTVMATILHAQRTARFARQSLVNLDKMSADKAERDARTHETWGGQRKHAGPAATDATPPAPAADAPPPVAPLPPMDGDAPPPVAPLPPPDPLPPPAQPEPDDPTKPVMMKIYIEGDPTVDSKILSLRRGILCHELRAQMAAKLNVDPNSFWIFLQKDNAERNVGEGEALLSDPEKEVVTVKLVAGSHYYTFQQPAADKKGSDSKASKKEKDRKKRRSRLF